MSWSRIIALALVGGLLAGCGYRPLYATSKADPGVTSELSRIRVAVIPDRAGQVLRNHLRTLLTPRGARDPGLYLLKVRLNETITNAAQRTDETATRAILRLTAHFSVVDQQSGKQILDGSTISLVAYDLVDSEYATLAAEADARRTAVRNTGDEIKTRLAAFFHSRGAARTVGRR
jgi:LPS-assembly lipoprotein